MPHVPVHPSAQKRHRQNLKRRERNRAIKSRVHAAVKEAAEAIAGTDPAAAKEKLRAATRLLDKAGSKGTLNRNLVRRQVARLSARLHKAQSQAAAQPKAP
ncbi:MAG TPA: 30S ribosomal protein S20 [Candidatus Binataceae bacterium]|nr:30S ribosomal protein S20 [Candidatus Binataceae bacterium]